MRGTSFTKGCRTRRGLQTFEDSARSDLSLHFNLYQLSFAHGDTALYGPYQLVRAYVPGEMLPYRRQTMEKR